MSQPCLLSLGLLNQLSESDEFLTTLDNLWDELQKQKEKIRILIRRVLDAYTHCMMQKTENLNIPKEINNIILQYINIDLNTLENQGKTINICQIDDDIKTLSNLTGTIKCVLPNKSVIGLQLNRWHPEANDGSIDRDRYFISPPGRGCFIHFSNVIQIKHPIKTIKKPWRRRFNFSWQYLADYYYPKWQLVVTGFIRRFVSDIDNISGIIYDFARIVALDQYPAIGNRVKLFRGKTGKVVYIASSPKNGYRHYYGKVIGIKLDRWHPDATNGRMRGDIGIGNEWRVGIRDNAINYFHCPDGYGYFTYLKQIMLDLGPANNRNHDHLKHSTKKILVAIKAKLREIEMLQFKQENGVQLNQTQIHKINEKERLIKQLETITKNSFEVK